MFDPTVGRWLQEDPEGFDAGDPNLFRYVKNGPTNDTDPSGLTPALVSLLVPTLPARADPPKLPNAGSLSWNDFKKVQKSDYDAFTGVEIVYNEIDIKTNSAPEGADFIGTATLRVQFRAEFQPKKSYVLNGKATASLLKHERLHLAIGEHIADKATLNLPDNFKGSRAKAGTAEEAGMKAKDNLIKLLETKRKEATDILVAVTKKYDDETKHGGVKEAQMNWERNYTRTIDDYVRTKYKWQK